MESHIKIVPIDQIPKANPCPMDDLINLYKTCLSLEKLCEKESGIGLSAVQVGIPWDLFVIKFGVLTGGPSDSSKEKDQTYYRYFLNCKYDPIDNDKEKSLEGCLSLRTKDGKLRHFEVERYKHIRVIGSELVSREDGLKVIDFAYNPDESDYYKIVFQHESDHSLGILINQIGKEYQIWTNF